MSIAQFALTRGDFSAAPINVFALGVRIVRASRVIIRCNDTAAGDVEAIHDHEAARGRDFGMDVKRDRLSRVQGQFAHLVAANEDLIILARDGRQRGRINNFLDGCDTALDFLGSELELVGFPFGKRLLAEPEKARFELR